ncbi:hypothetical protein [Bifidobacterium myosotis]|nr:hypothetical protein [Bifidobacterium myosotis]
MKSRFMGIGKDRQVRAHFAQTRIGKKWQTAAKHNKSGMAKNDKHRFRRILCHVNREHPAGRSSDDNRRRFRLEVQGCARKGLQ